MRSLFISIDTARRLYEEGGENRELALSVYEEDELVIVPKFPDKSWVWALFARTTRILLIYDAKNDGFFRDDGKRDKKGWQPDHIEPYTGEKFPWMIEAEKILED